MSSRSESKVYLKSSTTSFSHKVFTADGDVHIINELSKPSKLLSISRMTRQVYTKLNYGGKNPIIILTDDSESLFASKDRIFPVSIDHP